MTNVAQGNSPTASDLRRVVSYDPETGIFRWTERPSQAVRVGDVAGSISRYGYRVIGISGQVFMAHRLAWLWMTGSWPTQEIDHRDRDRANNAWTNLRSCERSENQENRKGGHGTSRFIGVSYKKDRTDRPWCARIMKGRKAHSLGYFKCETAAYVAYSKAKRSIHQFASGG